MKTTAFNYDLPPELIAQHPLPRRDASRLLVLHRDSGRIEHRQFTDILDYLHAGDILVANNSRVIPARLYGHKATGGRVELLLLEQLDSIRWQALVGGKRITKGTVISLHESDGRESDLTATVTAVLDGPQREITFNRPIDEHLERLGHTPLPPYIHESLEDGERYQTVYARPPGST
ncbi:MAG TPA: S-adenosylmethionine:tRNA ribosyltransferase-isomerase, partial [Anaerolineae bacterium]